MLGKFADCRLIRFGSREIGPKQHSARRSLTDYRISFENSQRRAERAKIPSRNFFTGGSHPKASQRCITATNCSLNVTRIAPLNVESYPPVSAHCTTLHRELKIESLVILPVHKRSS
jgi:hypothetical protein